MEFDNSFEVPLPPAQAWKVLLDIERIAPCMPGAELTEVVGKTPTRARSECGSDRSRSRSPASWSSRRSTRRITPRASRPRAPTPRAAAAPTRPRIPAGAGGRRIQGAGAHQPDAVGLGRAIRARRRHHPGDRHADHESVRQEPEGEARQDGAARPAAARLRLAAPPSRRRRSCRRLRPPPAAKPISGFSLMAQVIWSWITGLFRRP